MLSQLLEIFPYGKISLHGLELEIFKFHGEKQVFSSVLEVDDFCRVRQSCYHVLPLG